MNKTFFALLLLAFAAYGQKRIAIINTVDDGEPPIKHSELNHLTDRLREIAVKTIPEKSYAVMTQQSIVAYLGSQEDMVRKCKESEGCLAKLGREINADYICQARIGRFGKDLTIKSELYEVQRGNLVGSFTGSSKDIYGLLSVLDKETSDMFKKMPGVSVKAPVAGGISGLQSGTGDEPDVERRYLVNFVTEPVGAALSFNGVPATKCTKTPCRTELEEGNVRIIAALDQYETADTTVSIKQNNQVVSIRLKSNFGVLEIKPAYSEDVGRSERWSLIINGKAVSSWENKLSPGKYSVKLVHRCYENISFDVGINKDSREVFDMASHAKLKKGVLTLSAERDGNPVSEAVFVNGQRAGETPFSGSVAVCSKIEVGGEAVNVSLKHNDKIAYTHIMGAQKPAESYQWSSTSDLENAVDVELGYTTPVPEKIDPMVEEYSSGSSSFGVALVLDLLGATFLTYGIIMNVDASKKHDDYNSMLKNNRPSQSMLKAAWENAEDAKTARNVSYILGGIFLATGIGIHIWF